jgi:hypothetical protein
METPLEILAASPLWDDTPTPDIPLAFILYASLGCVSVQYPVMNEVSHALVKLWLLGVPIIIDRSPSPPLSLAND